MFSPSTPRISATQPKHCSGAIMTIRPATNADISDIFAIRTNVRENHLSLEQLRHMGITEESIGSIISEAECTWIAEAEGVTVGFAMADAEDGSVFALFVRPKWEN